LIGRAVSSCLRLLTSGCLRSHLARFVVEVIDGLDLRAMSGVYRGSGSASYHPRMLLGILVYGYDGSFFEPEA
jgi:transposase